jgi:Tfp pilus assembly protein PilF
MSVISDALKRAQKERQRRESGAQRDESVPLIVPLRSTPVAGRDWRRSMVMAVGLVVIVGAIGAMVVGQRAEPSQLPLQAPALTPELASALDAPTPAPDRASERRARPADPVTSATSSRVHPPAVRIASAVRDLDSPTAADSTPVARADTEAPPAREPVQAGRLRIAVDQPANIDAARLFQQAVAAHRAGDLSRARSAYERVLVLVPSDVDVMNNMAVLLSSLREFDSAEELLRRAVGIAPSNASIWNNLGSVLRERGRPSDAIAAFQRAIAIDPRHQGARVSLAQQYLAINALTEARALLDDVLAVNPALAEAQYALGQVLELQGDRAGAIRAYTAFVRVAPPRLAAHVERVRLHLDTLGSPDR